MSRISAFVALVLVTVQLVALAPAEGATACATQILRQWSADGRVADTYSLPCYEEAIDALPSDIRDYTNAEDVITRALTNAARATDPRATGVPSSDHERPLPLIALGGVSLAVLVAGAVGYVLRRRTA